MSMLYVCMEMEPGVPTSKSNRFTCLHDQICAYSLYIHFHLSLNILKKISSTSAHHLPLSQQANREPQISFSLFFPPCLSLNSNVIPFYLTQLLQAEATLRECAQHLSPSCCWGVHSLRLPAWASLCCVLYKQPAAAVPPAHLCSHTVAITETVKPLNIRGSHSSSHGK